MPEGSRDDGSCARTCLGRAASWCACVRGVALRARGDALPPREQDEPGAWRHAGLPRGGLCHRVLPGASRKGARAPARSGRSAGLGVHGAWHRLRVGADSHRQDGGRIYGIFGSEWFSYFQEFELLTQPLTAMLASLCCAIVLRCSLVLGTCVLVGREDAGGVLRLLAGWRRGSSPATSATRSLRRRGGSPTAQPFWLPRNWVSW